MSERSAHPTILMVEDNDDNRTVYRSILEHFGFGVHEARNGEDGVRMFFELRPDLLIADISIPLIDGWEMITMIRRSDQTTPILILSAHALATDRAKGFEVGASAYLAKPVDPWKVISEVEVLLEERGTRAALERRIQWARETAAQHRKEVQSLSDALTRCESELRRRLRPGRFRLLRSRWRKRGGANAPVRATAISGEIVPALVSSVTHALKGELASIAASVRLLEPSAEREELMELVTRSVRFSQSLIEMLTEAFQPGAATAESVDLADATREAVELARARLPDEVKIVLNASVPGDRPARVAGNRAQIIGVLLEVLRNAGRAMTGSEGTVHVALRSGDDTCSVEIRDEGPGFKAEVLQEVGSSPIPRRGGLGLGLYLSQILVQRIGGHLGFENTGDGARVTLVFPVHDSGKADE